MNLSTILTIFLVCLATTQAQHFKCSKNAVKKIILGRVVGETNANVWVCVCETAHKTVALSRTEVPAPQGDEDTAAKSLAILRCADNEADRLTRACIKNPNRFKRRASAVLTRCSSVSPTAEEKKTEGPFRFRQPCQARSIRFVRDTALVWICSCKYRSEMPQDVLVVPSRAQFNAASPAEVTALERCTRRKQAQLDDVCSRTPQDFKTLASHLMESCCKELRVDSKSKFQCEKAGFM